MRMTNANRKNNGAARLLGAVLSILLLLSPVLTACDVFTSSPVGTKQPGASSGTNPAGSGDTTAPVSADAKPVISEVMASNKSALAADGGYYDWIEIYNPTQFSIELKDYALSDNLKKPKLFVFPSYVLGPGKCLLVYATGEEGMEKDFHAAFKLSSAGEQLVLTSPDGVIVQQLTFPACKTDFSYAMDPQDNKKYAMTDKITPGYPNTSEGSAAFLAARHSDSPLKLNEVMAGQNSLFADEDGDYSDWVELCNTSDQPMDLSGYGLSNSMEKPTRWKFPKMSLEPGKYLVVYLSGKNRTDAKAPLHADFKLSDSGDTLVLANQKGQIIGQLSVHSLNANESFGVKPGSDKWKAFEHPTPGYPNTEDGFNALQQVLYPSVSKSVSINEVMTENTSTLTDQYKETPGWVELVNNSSEPVNLKDYGLSDNGDEPLKWKFPSITIEPGKYLTVFLSGRDQTAGAALSKRKLHTSFKLKSGGDSLTLSSPDGKRVDICLVPKLRPGVTYGRPEGKAAFQYLAKPTPDEANPEGFNGFTANPVMSVKAGQYEDAQDMTIQCASEDASIYFTQDGTVPTSKSTKYSDSITITKSTPLRVIAIQDGYISSDVVSATYLIGEDIKLPIVCIVTDPKNLNDYNTGIFAKGPGASAEPPYSGANFWKDWERPAHVELIEPDGTVGLSQNIGLSVFGAYSRQYDQKGMSIIARNEYGDNSLDYQIFPNLPYKSYKSFILRNSAMDANLTRIRDSLQTSLVADTTELDVQAYRQSIVFINGEFWGVYDIREKVNENFLAQHHDLDPDKIDLLVANGEKKSQIVTGSNTDYVEMREYIRKNDMTVQKNYDYVKTKMDVDNYIDWCCAEIYTVNSDLGNIKFWRSQEEGGKWRWIFYDLDWGFYFLKDNSYYLDPFVRFFDARGNGVSHMFDNSIARALIKNPEFKQKFIERFAYMCNVTFTPETVLARVDEMTAAIEPYMARDKAKWKMGSVASWKNQLKRLRNFAEQRQDMNKAAFKKFFKLTEAQMTELFPE